MTAAVNNTDYGERWDSLLVAGINLCAGRKCRQHTGKPRQKQINKQVFQ